MEKCRFEIGSGLQFVKFQKARKNLCTSVEFLFFAEGSLTFCNYERIRLDRRSQGQKRRQTQEEILWWFPAVLI